MVPWSHFSIHHGLLKEIEKVTTFDELKQVVKHLLRDNYLLSRKLIATLKSLENQRILIKYLQEALKDKMSEYSIQVLTTLAALGSETLRSIDNLSRYQLLANSLLKAPSIQKLSKEAIVQDFKKAAFAVPAQYMKSSRLQFMDLLAKLHDGGYDDLFDQLHVDAKAAAKRKRYMTALEDSNQRKRTMTARYKLQNNRINVFQRNRKQDYRIKAKRNACRTSRKHSSKNLKNNKSGNTYRRNLRCVTVRNSGETSYNDAENVQSRKFAKKRRYKRKFEEVNDECLNSDNEISLTVNKSPVRKTKYTKKLRSSYYSISKSIKLKPCYIKLYDVMTDPSAENDRYVAQYKQAYGYKGNEEIEYEIVDEAGDDIDCDQRTESDPNSDDNDNNDNEDDEDNDDDDDDDNDQDQNDRVSTKSHESDDDDLEDDADAFKSIESEENDDELPNNALSNGVASSDAIEEMPESTNSHR